MDGTCFFYTLQFYKCGMVVVMVMDAMTSEQGWLSMGRAKHIYNDDNLFIHEIIMMVVLMFFGLLP